jgi:energy-coupling factor transporter ATP-binding protein EcfA2
MGGVYDYDVFIIYAKEDEAWVMGYLLDALEQSGIKVNYPEKFDLGLPELSEFERGVRSSKRTLLIISHAHNADHFNEFVVSMSQTHGLESGTWPLIPMLLNDVLLPPRLSLLVKLDATTPEKRDKAIERLCKDLKTELRQPSPIPPCPYRGMLPYEEEHSTDFYGRESEIEVIKGKLVKSPIYAIIGPSGCGKSSIVKAGIIPQVRVGKVFHGSNCQIKELRFGDSPNKEILPQQNELQETNEHNQFLLFIDQFEEIFSAETDEQRDILDAIKKITEVPFCHVIFTMRADFYAELMESCLWSSVQVNKIEIGQLTSKGLHDAIMRPAEKAGVYIESALVERLVAEASTGNSVLPFLQETMVLLWDRIERRYLSIDAYERLILPYKNLFGDGLTAFEITMSRAADAALSSLTTAQTNIARRVFLQLIRFDDVKTYSRRQQLLIELVVESDNENDFDKTINCLINNRLLVLSNNVQGGIRVDIAHEALIRGWQQLQDWIEKYGQREKLRRYLQLKVNAWKKMGKGTSGLLDKQEYDFFQKESKKEDFLDNPVKEIKEDLNREILNFLELSIINCNPGWNRRGTYALVLLLSLALFDAYAVYYLGNIYLSTLKRFVLLVSISFSSLFFSIFFYRWIKREPAILQKLSWFLAKKEGVAPVLLSFCCSFVVFYYFIQAGIMENECNAIGIHKSALDGGTYGINVSKLNEDEKSIFITTFRRFYTDSATIVGVQQNIMESCKSLFEFSFDIDIKNNGANQVALLQEIDDRHHISNRSNPIIIDGSNRCTLMYTLANTAYASGGHELSMIDYIPPSQNLDCASVKELASAVENFYIGKRDIALGSFQDIHNKYPDDQLSLAYILFMFTKYAMKDNSDVLGNKIKSKYSYVNYLAGEYFLENNDINKAISYYNNALNLIYPWGELRLSYMYTKLGNKDEGKMYFEKAVTKVGDIKKNLKGSISQEGIESIYDREFLGAKLTSELIDALFYNPYKMKELCETYKEYDAHPSNVLGNGFLVSRELFNVCH